MRLCGVSSLLTSLSVASQEILRKRSTASSFLQLLSKFPVILLIAVDSFMSTIVILYHCKIVPWYSIP
jgi:hypothetical protein